jgi:predicted phosphodiesterase
MSKNSRILLIPDMHAPYMHADTWKFLSAIKKKYKPDRVICLGDEVDHHALSYHESDPDLDSAGPELEKAIRFLKPLYKLFPNVDVLESNHGSLVYRKAKNAGIPRRMLVSYREALDAPKGWVWHFDLRIKMSNGIDLYLHHGKSSKTGELSLTEGCCTAEGHHHTKFGVVYWRNSSGLYWGLHSGYLADHNSLAQAYARSNMKKGVVGATMILNGIPHLIPMRLKSDGRWNGALE